MVILGLEKPVEYGSRQIFDPTMANMVLNAQNRYVQAMREDYMQGREDLKEFNKNFGDFFSPIQKDMEWYDHNVTGATRDLINNLYAQGIDPLRSAEGRAAISRWINNMPVGKINQLKQSAEAAKEYLKNKGVLEAEGKWDPEFERFANKGLMLDNWDTAINGMWTRTSPAELKTLKELTESWYNNRTPEILNQEDVESFGMKYDPRYDYTGFADRHLLDIAAGETPGWNGSIYSDYYRDLARRKVAAKGEPYTQADVEKQLQRDIATANREYKALERDANKFALEAQKHAYDVALENLRDKHERDRISNPGDNVEQPGYNIPEDVYVTSLAKGAGIEYLPQGGVTPGQLGQMLQNATKIQNAKIMQTRNVFDATGMFIAPEKIAALIQSDGKNGRGYFLNSSYFKNLHDIQDIRTSYKGWLKTGSSKAQSKLIREQNKQKSKDIVSGIVKWNDKNKKSGFRLKVVPITDENNNNIYGMVGDDGKWHTYARMRVYMSNGKETISAGAKRNVDEKVVSDIPTEGKEMLLEVGLHSNKNAATPDLSVTAREDLGFYGYDGTSKKVGRELNSGFPYSTNTLKH